MRDRKEGASTQRERCFAKMLDAKPVQTSCRVCGRPSPSTFRPRPTLSVVATVLVADDAVRRVRSRHSDGDRSAKMSFADRLALLDESTKSLLRSGVVTPSLPIALVELVENALDAQATRIDVEVDGDPASPTIRVSDDGRGLSRDMLNSVGRFRYRASGPLSLACAMLTTSLQCCSRASHQALCTTDTGERLWLLLRNSRSWTFARGL